MRLLLVCGATLAGIAIADLRQVAPGPLLLGCVLALVATVCTRSRAPAVVALTAALGALRVALLPALPPLPISDGFAALREAARQGISANLPEPQASLAAGVLLGGRGHLDFAFRADLQRSGLSHFLAIDGFKQVVLAGGVGWLACRLLGARFGLLASTTAVVAYTLLTGAHASAIRAALMLTLASLAAASGRLPDPLTSVALASLTMALLDPPVLLDLGLQLSVSATLGLILLWPMLRRTLHLHTLPRWLAEPLGLSTAVTLACLPVTLAVFDQVSLVSPLAHVVAVPLLAPVLLGAALLSVLAPLPAPAPSIGAWLVWMPTSLLAATVRVFGSLPGAAVSTGRLPLPATVLLAFLLLACGVWHLPELADVRHCTARWLSRNRQPLRATSAPTTSAARPG